MEVPMRTSTSFSLGLVLAAITTAACGSDDTSTPALDAAADVDSRVVGPDAAVGPDATPGPDAMPGVDPTFAVVPCAGASTAASVEYYSCGFFIGGGSVPVGAIVQFFGCDGHTVKSGAGATLITTFGPVCLRMTGPGTLNYACEQHPAHAGSITVTP
jgi:hypothetical protein